MTWQHDPRAFRLCILRAVFVTLSGEPWGAREGGSDAAMLDFLSEVVVCFRTHWHRSGGSTPHVIHLGGGD